MSGATKNKQCRNFILGNPCQYGTACKFLHTAEVPEAPTTDGIICLMYQKTRTCKYGDKCMYQHVAEERNSTTTTSSTKPRQLNVPKIQAIQKKRKENPVKVGENLLKVGRGAEPIREKKLKKGKGDRHLDDEAYSEKRLVKTLTPKSFCCFRCNFEKSSTQTFEWATSEGVKVICNGCNGNLVAKTR